MRESYRTILGLVGSILVAMASVACSDDDGISSNERARRAYLGLDPSIAKSLSLGFDGFNTASSANISPQTADGDATGVLTITGQVDQGASANKGMRLRVGMVAYSDGVFTIATEDETVEVDLTYDTSDVQTAQPYLQLSLRGIPELGQPPGTFTGTLTGVYRLRGDLDAEVELSLSMSGGIANVDGVIVRTPGTTTVTGTATSGDGHYEVSLTL
jgi:hypothetical protein